MRSTTSNVARAENHVIDLTLSEDEDKDRKPREMTGPLSAKHHTDLAREIIDLTGLEEGQQINTPFASMAAAATDGYTFVLSPRSRIRQEESDAKLAAQIHDQEAMEMNRTKQQEIDDMKNSDRGKAILIVKAVTDRVLPFRESGIEPVGKDEAVPLALKFITCLDCFKHCGKTTKVTVNYHYTSPQNMGAIREDGLLTIEDRIASNCGNRRNVAYFGNGIYTGTNPVASVDYGEKGLMVAIVPGTEQNVGNRQQEVQQQPSIDTIIGNKTGDAPYHDEVILRRSCQVLPLVMFPRQPLLDGDAVFLETLWLIHHTVLQPVLDEFLNNFVPTALTRVLPSCLETAPMKINLPQAASAARALHIARLSSGRDIFDQFFSDIPIQAPLLPDYHGTVTLSAVLSLNDDNIKPFKSVSPDVFVTGKEECPLCLNELLSAKNPVEMNVCGHCFCIGCIEQCLAKEQTCPYCRTSTKEPKQGSGPSGTMYVTSDSTTTCHGYPEVGTICINYHIPSGVQSTLHPYHPGAAFIGFSSHKAYLPKNKKGQALAKRLAYAFSRGISWTIGARASDSLPANNRMFSFFKSKSLKNESSGKLREQDENIGRSVLQYGHHEASLVARIESWSDPTYFEKCNNELDAMYVPKADELANRYFDWKI